MIARLSRIWPRLSPPVKATIATLAVCLAIQLTLDANIEIYTGSVFLVFVTTFCSYQWGLTGGVPAVLISILYLIYYFSTPGQILDYSQANSDRLITYILMEPAFAIMAARRRDIHRATLRSVLQRAVHPDQRELVIQRIKLLAEELDGLHGRSKAERDRLHEIAKDLRSLIDAAKLLIDREDVERLIADSDYGKNFLVTESPGIAPATPGQDSAEKLPLADR